VCAGHKFQLLRGLSTGECERAVSKDLANVLVSYYPALLFRLSPALRDVLRSPTVAFPLADRFPRSIKLGRFPLSSAQSIRSFSHRLVLRARSEGESGLVVIDWPLWGWGTGGSGQGLFQKA